MKRSKKKNKKNAQKEAQWRQEKIAALYRGPTDASNWLVRGKILTGAYPGNRSSKHTTKLGSLLNEGRVSVFISLQTEDELEGQTPFEETARQMKQNIVFMQCPLAADEVDEDEKVQKYVKEILHLLVEDRSHVLYIHCFQADPRVGIIASVILGILCDTDGEEAVQAFYEYRKARKNGFDKEQLAPEHVEQIERILANREEWYYAPQEEDEEEIDFGMLAEESVDDDDDAGDGEGDRGASAGEADADDEREDAAAEGSDDR